MFISVSVLVVSDERAYNGIAEMSAGLVTVNTTLLLAATVSVTVPVVLATFQQFAKLLLYESSIVPVNLVQLYH